MIEPGQYRHSKSGKMYKVLGVANSEKTGPRIEEEYTIIAIANHSETFEQMVVYQGLSGDLWVRPLAMFAQLVNVGDKLPNAPHMLGQMVAYQAEYGERRLWVRPLIMFDEAVTIDGKSVPRFVKEN